MPSSLWLYSSYGKENSAYLFQEKSAYQLSDKTPYRKQKILLTGFEKKVLTVLRKNSLPYDCKIILPPTFSEAIYTTEYIA